MSVSFSLAICVLIFYFSVSQFLICLFLPPSGAGSLPLLCFPSISVSLSGGSCLCVCPCVSLIPRFSLFFCPEVFASPCCSILPSLEDAKSSLPGFPRVSPGRQGVGAGPGHGLAVREKRASSGPGEGHRPPHPGGLRLPTLLPGAWAPAWCLAVSG